MDNGLNPGNRPRRTAAIVLVALAVGALVVVGALVASPQRADAAGLWPFSSCPALSRWGASAQRQVVTGGGDVVMSEASSRTDSVGVVTSIAPAPTSASGAASDSSGGSFSSAETKALDATNVVVDGVDELDLVDRLAGDRLLIVANDRLVIVDVGAAKVMARTTVPAGAQVTYDSEHSRAWVVGQVEAGVQVQRIEVGDGSLQPAGSWRTAGSLVDARRVGGQLHVVASDGFVGRSGSRVPFPGGPVPCDQVLHPSGPSEPTATLIATLPVDGTLTPVHATEVVGSGQRVHVTESAIYLATPQWTSQVTTSIHRFDLDTLRHTGSGSVPGTLLNDFSMSEHQGDLRVAITAGGGSGVGVGGPPIMVDDVAVPSELPVGTDGSPGPAGDTPTMGVAEGDVGESAPPVTVTTVPETTIPGDTTTTTLAVPPSTTTSTTTSTSTSTSTTTTSTTTTTPPTGTTIPGPEAGDPLNKVVVLDTDGNLDVIGSTPWFGHQGETLQGIRFDGNEAYAVTFLQTDPFYVIDLADPTAPKVAGQVQLPGFSAYLHPVGDGLVVGFGPGEDGRAAAKLFDVSDPAAPKVVDTIELGDEAPIVSDHHAFTDLGGGRFATPVTRWSTSTTECLVPPDAPTGPNVDYACLPSKVTTEVVELQVRDGHLAEVSRRAVDLPEAGTRALRADGGWAVLAGSTLGLVDDGGTQRPSLKLA